MKINIELKDEKFHYSWDVNGEKFSCEDKVNVRAYVLFAELLKSLSSKWDYDHKHKTDKFHVDLWCEQNGYKLTKEES